MQKMKFDKPNEDLLEKNFIKALKNPDFVNVVNNLDVDDKVKYRYTSSLMDIANNLTTCSKCKGLSFCPYEITGLMKYAYVENGIIKFAYKKCPFREKNDSDNDYQKNVFANKIPLAIKEASFKGIYKDDSNRLETIKELKKFYDEYTKEGNPKGLYLNGNFGCGKTYLIAALFNELAKKGYKSVITYFPEFLRSLKANFDDSEVYNYQFDRVKYAPLLLIDDIGAENLSDWARDEVLQTILQYRMEEKLPTFFTSNLTLEELESHLAITKSSDNKVKAGRIIQRIKFLSKEITMISANRREY